MTEFRCVVCGKARRQIDLRLDYAGAYRCKDTCWANSRPSQDDDWDYDRLPTPPEQLREAEVMARMREAARVAACSTHDQNGPSDEASGFPTCSKCGAILTATPPLDVAAQRVVDAYRATIPFSYISEETELAAAVEDLAARLAQQDGRR